MPGPFLPSLRSVVLYRFIFSTGPRSSLSSPFAPLDVSTPRSSVMRYSWKATRFRASSFATSARMTALENSWIAGAMLTFETQPMDTR